MMGEGAFCPLKSGDGAGETAKQAKTGLAGFPQIVCNGPRAAQKKAGKSAPNTSVGYVGAQFCWIWLIGNDPTILVLRSMILLFGW